MRQVWKNSNALMITVPTDKQNGPSSNNHTHHHGSLVVNLWEEALNRKPAHGPSSLHLVDTIEKCYTACEALRNDPVFPGVLGIDAEGINGPGPWSTWPDRHKTFSVGQPQFSGPFLRFLQIARADGYVAVFDVMALQGLPDLVMQLLTDDTLIRFGFAWSCDHVTIDRLVAPPHPHNPKTLCPLGLVHDTQARWSLLSDPLCFERVKHLPFRPSGNGLADFIRSAFSVNVDKKFQGSGQFWNRPASYFVNGELEYAALDALLHLDLGLLFCYWNLWSPRTPASLISFPSQVAQKRIPSLLSLNIFISEENSKRIIRTQKTEPVPVVPRSPGESRDVNESVTMEYNVDDTTELQDVHRRTVLNDVNEFRLAWNKHFQQKVNFWNPYAFVYRNTRARWYSKRYPQLAASMLEMLERKMSSIIVNKRFQIRSVKKRLG